MKLSLLLTAAAVAAVTLTATALAHPRTHHDRWQNLTLTQKRQVVVTEIRKERQPLRWWLSHRTRMPAASAAPLHYCAAVGTRLPGPICVHANRLVSAIHVLQRIDARIEARQIARSYAVALRDFATAASLAGRIFPGTYDWLMNCSGSEGGHGGWVWNGGYPLSQYPTKPDRSSGAGGWMQFMAGTFYGNVGGAFSEAAARGYRIPSAARSWYSTLGHAVTAAWMRYHGTDAGQWTGNAC